MTPAEAKLQPHLRAHQMGDVYFRDHSAWSARQITVVAGDSLNTVHAFIAIEQSLSNHDEDTFFPCPYCI
jgi:hypothetical protein